MAAILTVLFPSVYKLINNTRMLRSLALLFIFLGCLYFLLYPWLRHTVGRKKLFRWFLIIYGVVAVASTLGKVFLD